MGKKYNENYAKDTVDEYVRRMGKEYQKAEYTIEIEPEFNDPPVYECLKLISKLGTIIDDPDTAHRIAKLCIVGKQVKIYKDGDLITGGQFQINSINDSFDAYPIFKNDPKALEKLADTCVAYIMQKCMPSPRKKAESATA